MSVYYVGPGGSDAAAGTSWATRRLTLNGIEDKPVAAGDTIYVAPGVYRETLTSDVSGTAGNPITYIADVTGEHTDGVGGIVRVTASNDDLTPARNYCIYGNAKNYRTYRGFYCDIAVTLFYTLSCNNWIIEDCSGTNDNVCVRFAETATNNIVRRCAFHGGLGGQAAILFTHTATVDSTNNLVENCRVLCGGGAAIGSVRIGGVTVKNCTILASNSAGIRVITAPAAGQTMVVYNCIVANCGTGLQAPATTWMVEDYNLIYSCSTARSSVTAGANSVAYTPLFACDAQLAGYNLPQAVFGSLNEWSSARNFAGTSMSTDDLLGHTRPSVDAKKSLGAIQYRPIARDTTTKRTGAASLKLADAGRHQMFVPTDNTSTVFSCYVYWEANYAGTKPQMVIRQPGQADTTVTATGSSGAWELLTATITPAASPAYCVVEFVSSNTATSGSYSVYADDFTVS